MSGAAGRDILLGDILDGMSRHFDGLADEVHAIEHAIGEELQGGGADVSGSVTRLQRLDFLRQSLEDMALLSLHLRKACPNLAISDVSSFVRLESTRTMLAGGHGICQENTDAESAGDVDLF